MDATIEKYHQIIIGWNKEYSKLPKTNFITSAVILSIGVIGLLMLFILNPDTLYFLSIFIASTFLGGIWFSMMLRKLLKHLKIRNNLAILMDLGTFSAVIKAIIKIRAEKKGVDSAELLRQKLAEFGITSRYLIIELNRLVREIQKTIDK